MRDATLILQAGSKAGQYQRLARRADFRQAAP